MRGHQPDLPVEALHQHDPETVAAQFAGLAGQGDLAVQRHAAAHAAQEFVADLMVHHHQIFLLQLVLGAQDRVDDVAVAGQQDQAFRILVQTPDREDPLLVADEIDDVALHVGLGGAGHADRLVQGDIDVPALALGRRPRLQRLAVDAHLVAFAHFGADPAALSVDRDPAFADQPVGLAPRAVAGVADVFVEAHGALRWNGRGGACGGRAS